MKKNKLSIIFAILTCICIFSVAAIADQCGCRAIPIEEKIDVEETEEEISGEEASAKEEEIFEETEEETEEVVEEEQETPEQEEQTEAPTIELEIYEGPIYSSNNNVCYYRIKAIVTGSPTPTISFSKDDSGGAWGSKKTQINLSDPAETYTLTATATNSEAAATDSIALSWGCPIPNNPPEILEITLMGNHYVGLEYTISAAATDPDGDSLSYSWSVTGGTLDNPGSDSVKWTMPDTAGSYNITVTVDDGNGGEAGKTETVIVLAFPSVELPQIPGGGFILNEVNTIPIPVAKVGDSIQDKTFRGFLSFDISSLAGKEVASAEMKFEQFHIEGDPYSIIEKIWVEAVYWGTDDINLQDYNLPGVILGEYDIPTFTCSSIQLRDALNLAIDDGHDRFQIRLRHMGFQTNHNGIVDTIRYGGAFTVIFNASYMP